MQTISQIKPFIHQKNALANIFDNHKGIIKNDRTQVIMSCGTGKTLLSMWIHEKYVNNLKESITLLFYPSLFLVNQTYNTYKDNTILKFNPLVVCSDTSIGDNENDDVFEIETNEVKYPVTTNLEDIKIYLQDKNIKDKIIFVTYQSSQLVGQALNELAMKATLGIFDEAHKTATANIDSIFAFALKDENVPITKRLFMTATPRHIKFNVENEDDEEIEVFSMNNPELYGNIAYEYSMRDAINDGIITDYKIMGILIDDKYIDSYTNELKPYNEEIINEAKIKAINEAMNKYGLNKALIFNSGTHASKELEKYANTNIFNKTIKHLDGKSKHSYRESVIQELRDNEQFVITNARLFTEGVDLPVIDMVALFRNVRSEIDIIQTIGRIQRIDKNNPKKIGYILLPIFVSNIDLIDEELKTNKDLGYVYDVISSLKENDEQLKATLDYKKQNNTKSKSKNKSNKDDDLRIKNPNFEIAYMTSDADISDEYIRQVSEKITHKIEAIILDKREPKHYTDYEWKSFFKEFDTNIGNQNLRVNTIYKNVNLGNKIIILKTKYKKSTPEQQITLKKYWDCLPEEIWGELKRFKKDEDWRELYKLFLKENNIENLTETTVWKGEYLGRKLNRLRSKYNTLTPEQQNIMLSYWDCFEHNIFIRTRKDKFEQTDVGWKKLFIEYDNEFGIASLFYKTLYKNKSLGIKFADIKTRYMHSTLEQQKEIREYWDCIPENMWMKINKTDEEWKELFKEFDMAIGLDSINKRTVFKGEKIGYKFQRIRSKYKNSSHSDRQQMRELWDCFTESLWVKYN